MTIDIQNLGFRYPGMKSPVFSDFSMQLTANNIYGLLGKNGTGKSTLLYIISGLLHPQGGTVTIDGVAPGRRLPSTLEEIFIVPEEYELPSMTLDEYVRINEPFYPRFSREVLRKCLEDFELTTDLHLNALSMGQKKKVYMSFALAAGTRLLLMDEPTNGLDIPAKAQFRRVEANYMSDDRMLLISTHQVHDVETLLDHILILSQSQLLLDTPVSDICQRYCFAHRSPGEDISGVLYSEPTIQGNAVVTLRSDDMVETPLDLELLFNAVTSGSLSHRRPLVG